MDRVFIDLCKSYNAYKYTFIMKWYEFMVEIVYNRNIIFNLTPYGTNYYTSFYVTIIAN